MSHLDEGTLHAMLDGELEPKEVAEIQAHVGSCTSCGLRLREVREFLDEADRLIASVGMDGAVSGAPMRRSEPSASPEAAMIDPPRAQPRVEPTHSEPIRPELPARTDPPRPEPVVRSQATEQPEAPVRPEPQRPAPPRAPHPVPARAAATETWNAPPPPLLMPDNESVADRRMRRMQKYGWAAMVLVFIGAGFIGVRMREPLPVYDTPAARSANAVVSPEETARPDAPVTTDSLTAPAAKPAADRSLAAKAPARAEAPKTLAKRAVKDSDTEADAAADTPTPAQTLASGSLADSELKAEAQPAEAALTAANEPSADSATADDLASVRERASEALADLDRERRRKDAAAATAALDAQRRRRAASQTAPTAGIARAAAPPAAAPAPTPPTLEQRAQVYLRIGLDEASRQLGGPAHVIEGMSAMFMGLAQGVVVPGADATRPVVRVVYQDSQGRLIMLDQQRLRPGQPAPPGTALGWVLDGTAIWLHGEAGPDVLRLYRPRVR